MTGQGEAAQALPPPFMALQAMKMLAGHFYANRESQDIPPGAMRVLDLLGRLEA